MEDDQAAEKPYRAEYAKSGRSNCKSCKTSIEKESLRLGVMVQSPVVDAKVPNWYHFMCFFTKQRPKTVDDFAHFDSLRWEDQGKLKEKLSEVANTAPQSNGKSRKRGKKSDSDFSVEYAKSSRALCKGCEIKIAKDEIRVSKKDFESDQAKKLGGLDRWYHLECFVKLRAELEFFDSGDTLPGIDTLKKEDKSEVKTSLPKMDKLKVKDEVDGVPEKKIKIDVKTEKKEDTKELDALMKKQNKLMYKYHDNLKPLTRTELSMLLLSNDQDDPVGHDRKLDRLQDVMAFGALEPCSVCKNGKFIFVTGVGYQCQGDMSEWSKCLHVEEKPKRKPFVIPTQLSEKYAFLEKYECKLGDRAFKKVENVPKPVKVEASTSAKIERFAPFRGMVFFIIGKELKENKKLRSKIEKWGGTVTSKLTTDVAVVISTEGEIKKMSSKMSEVEEMKIHVVPQSFVDACEKGDPLDKIKEMSISPWDANDPKKTVDTVLKKSQALKSEALKSGGSRFAKSMSRVKLKIVDGSAVDPDSDMADVCHVFNDGKDIWSAVLGLSNVQTNKNSYYKLQLLEANDEKRYYVFRSWGRIGTKIGGKKLESVDTLKDGKKLFREVYLDHSGNDWSDRHNFQKRPGLMYPIDIDYGENDKFKKLSEESSIKSTLAPPVQELVKMIFDVELMKKVMMEFELDMEKMPLGKLSKKQIQKAFAVLSELQGKDGDIKPKIVTDATNRFYTLIPHNFGTQAPPLLDNAEIIQAKLSMLESLLEMEVAYGLLKEVETTDEQENVNPIDSHYAKLNTSIEVLDRDSSEFKLVEKYVKNTHGKTHTQYALEIVDVFKIKRSGESKKFKPFKKLHNRQLLWHGSRITNYVGILSQGLRIAPPEAPTTGYMFGKGVYFADMVSKSANYCMTSPSNPYGLIMLCEVALGDMYERTRADYIEVLPKGKHSTKGLGLTMPDPAEVETLEDGLQVPLGKPVNQFSNKSQTSLLYNEFIVYDVAQIQVHYLLKLKFNYNM